MATTRKSQRLRGQEPQQATSEKVVGSAATPSSGGPPLAGPHSSFIMGLRMLLHALMMRRGRTRRTDFRGGPSVIGARAIIVCHQWNVGDVQNHTGNLLTHRESIFRLRGLC